MATKQYKQLGCLDVQPAGGCGFQVRAETEAEVLQLVPPMPSSAISWNHCLRRWQPK